MTKDMFDNYEDRRRLSETCRVMLLIILHLVMLQVGFNVHIEVGSTSCVEGTVNNSVLAFVVSIRHRLHVLLIGCINKLTE